MVIVFAIKKWRPYLLWKKFTVRNRSKESEVFVGTKGG